MNARKNTDNCEPLALGMHQAARVLGISQRTLFTLLKAGDVPHVRIGRRVLFRRVALEAWLAARETRE